MRLLLSIEKAELEFEEISKPQSVRIPLDQWVALREFFRAFDGCSDDLGQGERATRIQDARKRIGEV